MTLAKPSTLLGAVRSGSPPGTSALAFCLHKFVVLYVMYVCWYYVQDSNFAADPEGRCLALLILSYS